MPIVNSLFISNKSNSNKRFLYFEKYKRAHAQLNKILITKIYLWIMAIFTFFWWPLSHWFYPDWYHSLLGFKSYDLALVRIIGTCGFIPSIALIFAALRPCRNRDLVITLIIFSFLMCLTYIYLIIVEGFPRREVINVGLLLANIIILCFIYPWRYKYRLSWHPPDSHCH